MLELVGVDVGLPSLAGLAGILLFLLTSGKQLLRYIRSVSQLNEFACLPLQWIEPPK